ALAAHQVATHQRQVRSHGLNQHHAGALCPQLARLVTQSSTGPLANGIGDPVKWVACRARLEGGGRVQADDQVEPLVHEQVEVGCRVHPAVDVAATIDL